MNPLMNWEDKTRMLEWISHMLEVKLTPQFLGRIRDLQVLPQKDGFILRGRASTYHAKQLAQHALLDETTLPLIKNEIEIL